MTPWEMTTIGEIGQVFDGPHATPKTIDDGPVFLGISSLNFGRLDLSNTRHVSEEDFAKWTKRVEPKAGDIVFSYETKIGEAAVVPKGLRCCLGRRMGLVRLDPAKCDARYFLYQYLSPNYQQFLASRTVHGATVDRLLLKDFPSFDFPLPPIEEQREIAAVLGVLDDKIELNRKTAATLEAMARALYRSWFVDFDPVRAKAEGRTPAHMDEATAALFPDSFGDDGLPVGWELEPVRSLCSQVKQTVKPMEAPDAEFWHFSLPAYDNGAVPVRELGAAIKSNKLFVPNDAILFSRLNPSIPRVWWARADHSVATPAASTEFFVARARASDETPWLYCLLSSPEFREQALFRVTGTSNSHQRVPPTTLAEIEVVAATPELISAFGRNTATIFDRIHTMSQENQTLAALRDALLPRLMSGELRVGEAREQVEDVA
ncbi:restriction endonuclease subunit S [Ruegeria arenilitoris]|uniref:restriction endonuclease subunit S n=1 Tax=Ruegeria arenilitoris TaxID=1173585 RepID=UPI00148172F5|nr:restriction endonuclease subunit S [Ruegeria arenilitoris]